MAKEIQINLHSKKEEPVITFFGGVPKKDQKELLELLKFDLLMIQQKWENYGREKEKAKTDKKHEWERNFDPSN